MNADNYLFNLIDKTEEMFAICFVEGQEMLKLESRPRQIRAIKLS